MPSSPQQKPLYAVDPSDWYVTAEVRPVKTVRVYKRGEWPAAQDLLWGPPPERDYGRFWTEHDIRWNESWLRSHLNAAKTERVLFDDMDPGYKLKALEIFDETDLREYTPHCMVRCMSEGLYEQILLRAADMDGKLVVWTQPYLTFGGNQNDRVHTSGLHVAHRIAFLFDESELRKDCGYLNWWDAENPA